MSKDTNIEVVPATFVYIVMSSYETPFGNDYTDIIYHSDIRIESVHLSLESAMNSLHIDSALFKHYPSFCNDSFWVENDVWLCGIYVIIKKELSYSNN